MAETRSRPLAAILTLGCKLNLADSEEIARGLRGAGFDTVDRLCEADAFVINTCSVTHVADQKSRRLIRSVQRIAPGARVTVTGCFPQSAGFDAATALGADLVVGTRDRDKQQLVEFLQRANGAASSRAGITGADVDGAPAPGHTRAFIKAQEGCNDVCAFCIVPRTRGREESRPVETVAAEVNAAVASGAREVVITGTQLGAWGRDLVPQLKPHHLIAGILAETEVVRLRFSSLQPQDISPELLALWNDPRLMPHFHLALQAGSDATLSAMRRRYSVQEFREAAARIRAAVPDAAITTDIIAGFPGESDADFEATLDFAREMQFARIHAFPYSVRQRTAAARMPGQVDHATKQERMSRLLSLGRELQDRYCERFAGSPRSVLWEHQRTIEGGTYWVGHTDNYIPVFTGDTRQLANRITATELGGLYHDGMTGTVVGNLR